MKLLKYLNEMEQMKLFNYDDHEITQETFVRHLKSECKPYLNMSGGLPLYRGYSDPGIETFRKIIPRTDRRPKDTPDRFHQVLDDSFKSKFGWRVRSEGVFTTGKEEVASDYANGNNGDTYLFFPIGKFKYVWSPEIPDMYIYLESNLKDKFNTIKEEDVFLHKIVKDKFINTDLERGIESHHEIVFKCDSYYLVNIIWLTYPENPFKLYMNTFGVK